MTERQGVSEGRPVRVLFICMGNICRSPTAEAVFRHYVEQAQLDRLIVADSAGTHDYHIGNPPDHRAQAAAARRGYDLSTLRARQVTRKDFLEFDYLLAMDDVNLEALRRLCPAEHREKLQLFGEYCSGATAGCAVPDPYYGEAADFEYVLDLTEEAAQRLLRHIRAARLSG